MSKVKINEDKIIQAVLSNEELAEEYKYNPKEYSSVTNAFYAGDDKQPIVVAVATIIKDIKNGTTEKEVYKKVVNLFNKNLA
jgi:hypothetical protein